MTGLSRFAVRKTVPINLLVAAILIAGITCGLTLRREFFPEIDPQSVLITMPYPGATPAEVEDSLAIKVEDKLADIDEIDEIFTTVAEGGGGITVRLHDGVNSRKALDEIDRAIDALRDLPADSERIQAQLLEPRLPVIRMALYGPLDEQVMKRAIRAIRDDLRMLPGMGEITIDGVREYEVRVDVDRAALMQNSLSLPQVSEAIRQWMAEVPGGTVRTATGNVRFRTMGVEERREAIRDIVVLAGPDGTAVRVRDIAEVHEGFVDEQVVNRFNGEPAAGLTVYKVGKQDVVKIAEMVRAYVDGRRGEAFHPRMLERLFTSDRYRAWDLGAHAARPLPPGAKVQTISDLARFVEGRLELLSRNALQGAGLVFLVLLIFLSLRSATWVLLGLTVAISGTLVLMFCFDITLNLLTMFGLIVVLGMLVDDGIVVAENIETNARRGEPALQAAISGATEMWWPVVVTVLTTVVAFLPLTFIKGEIGDLLGALPTVVACALAMSLVEALLILPSHMGHSLAKAQRRQPRRIDQLMHRYETWRDRLILDRLVPAYGRVLQTLLHYRYITTAAAAAVLLISLGMVAGDRVTFTFLDSTDSETIVVDLRMPIGSAIDLTEDAVRRIERAALDQPEVNTVSSIVGQRANIDTGIAEAYASHVAQMFIELHPVEQRSRESRLVIDSLRQATRGQLDEVDRIRYSEISGGPGGQDITVRIRGQDTQQIETAARRVKLMLAEFDGVYDIADDNDLGQVEMQVRLHPGAAALGFTVADVATQMRGFLYGLDAHVFADEEEDIDVRVRLDEATRRSLFAVDQIWLTSPTGRLVPLNEVARVEEATTYATIKRVDRRRAITVSADTAPWLSPETVTARLDLGALRDEFPALTIDYAGRQEQMADAFASLPWGFLAAVILIYVQIAWLFDSYAQPLMVMLVIPFSLIGVVWGHFLLGYNMTFLSLIGYVALSGIVVNDSIIFVNFYNNERNAGHSVFDALVHAGRARLRAIILTTVTTVCGLLPLMLEQSFQARFLIPMAISLAVGLISATVVVLVILPCIMLIFYDVKSTAHQLWHGRPLPMPTATPPMPADVA
jgi:HAE1 family hydrophobic/amphiphilic exporter-1